MPHEGARDSRPVRNIPKALPQGWVPESAFCTMINNITDIQAPLALDKALTKEYSLMVAGQEAISRACFLHIFCYLP